MNNKYISLLLLIITVPLFANSSWVYYIDKPYTILPIVIIITLFLEIFFIMVFNKIKKISSIFFGVLIIIVANLFSFIISYIFWGKIFGHVVPKEIENLNTIFEKIFYTFYNFPLYNNMGIELLILTLIIEVPFVYLFLKRYTKNKKKLILSIIIVNIISNVVITIFEKVGI